MARTGAFPGAAGNVLLAWSAKPSESTHAERRQRPDELGVLKEAHPRGGNWEPAPGQPGRGTLTLAQPHHLRHPLRARGDHRQPVEAQRDPRAIRQPVFQRA